MPTVKEWGRINPDMRGEGPQPGRYDVIDRDPDNVVDAYAMLDQAVTDIHWAEYYLRKHSKAYTPSGADDLLSAHLQKIRKR